MTAPTQDFAVRHLPGRAPASGVAPVTAVAPTPLVGRDHTLESAVVQAIAYADVFDWPLTPEEVHRYLPVPAELDEVRALLGACDVASCPVALTDGFATLTGREWLVQERLERERRSRSLWPRAARYARAVSALPFVRMVAITGSLAVDAATEDADVDLLVVTDDGRLWLARALVMAVVRGAALRGLELCPNYLLSRSALRIEDRNLFAAHELAQMVPVEATPAYRELMRQNAWYHDFLPNAEPRPPLAHTAWPQWTRAARRATEGPLRVALVDRLEDWERRRKVATLTAASSSSETRYDALRCKGHADEHGRRALAAYETRLVKILGEA